MKQKCMASGNKALLGRGNSIIVYKWTGIVR